MEGALFRTLLLEKNQKRGDPKGLSLVLSRGKRPCFKTKTDPKGDFYARTPCFFKVTLGKTRKVTLK